MKRRHLIGSTAAMLAVPSIARAQAWPANPIRVVHGYDAGSNPDTIARAIYRCR
jgi:tripartite-type tricarboxylate transporter receptor subunit TctC